MSLAVLGLGFMFTLDQSIFAAGQALHMMAVVPGELWGGVFILLGTARLVTLIVNGFWPVGPTVRWSLSITCIMVVWMPIVVSFWMMFPATKGYPTLVLSVIAAIGEAICLFALSALRAGVSGAK